MSRKTAAPGWFPGGILCLLGLLVACAPLGRDDSGTRVFIRSGGDVVSSYELSGDGLIQQSETQDANGGTVVRRYVYDSARRLVGVTSGGTSTSREVTMDHSSKGVLRKALSGPDGRKRELTLEYYYKTDGRLDGVIQRDEFGNVQAKGADQ